MVALPTLLHCPARANQRAGHFPDYIPRDGQRVQGFSRNWDDITGGILRCQGRSGILPRHSVNQHAN